MIIENDTRPQSETEITMKTQHFLERIEQPA